MALLQIEHRTLYRYCRPVELGAHRLLLRPRESHDLRLVSAELECAPKAALTWSGDVFGNSVAHAAFSEPAAVLAIVSRIVVEQCAPRWPVFAIATYAHEFPFDYSAEDRLDLGPLLALQNGDGNRVLQDWAASFVLGERTDTLSLLKDMNSGVSAAIRYQARDEEYTQTPIETLALGSGSCRDLAVLFADAARALGFAARIVSGYLVPSQDAALVEHETTHAWTDIYLPNAGWIAFDPTNGVMGSANLIPVAVARDIAQASPVSGSFIGNADDFLEMTVAVRVAPLEPTAPR